MKNFKYLFALLVLLAGYQAQGQAAAHAPQLTDLLDEELPAIGGRYYFYPNLDAYFDLQQNVYIFEQNGQWVKAAEIPSGYRGYSVLNGTRVEITDYNGDHPQTRLESHRQKWPKNYFAKRKPPKKEEPATTVVYK
jgi:hypothetical protein